MDGETICGEKHGYEPSLSSEEERGCEMAAILFRALGDANRLRILKLLARREMCVSELTVVLSDNLPAISQRLKLLRAERLVRTRRQGKHVYYRLADHHIAELIANGIAHAMEPEQNEKDPQQ